MKAYMPDSERKALIRLNDKTRYPSHFTFLQELNGWRPGKMHLIIGNAGGGKSTLVRSLLADMTDAIKDDENVLVFLSEENETDFKTEFSRSGYNNKKLMNVNIVSEVNFDKNRGILAYLEFLIAETKPSIVVFDNITTSDLYECGVQEQSNRTRQLKKLAIKYGIVLILVAHTGKQITSTTPRLISEQDIQGSSAPTKLSEFIFVMQSFKVDERITTTLSILKARGQEPKHRLFELPYARQARMYAGSNPMNFKSLKEIFKTRDTL
jgi:replicative DNA helicase